MSVRVNTPGSRDPEEEETIAAVEWARDARIQSRSSLGLLELFAFLEEARLEAECLRDRFRFQCRRELVARELGRRGAEGWPAWGQDE